MCVHHIHVPRLGQGRGRSDSWHPEQESEQGHDIGVALIHVSFVSSCDVLSVIMLDP